MIYLPRWQSGDPFAMPVVSGGCLLGSFNPLFSDKLDVGWTTRFGVLTPTGRTQLGYENGEEWKASKKRLSETEML